VRLITRYDTDIAGAAEALLAMLRQPPAKTSNTEPRTENERKPAEEAVA
jgi:hypothetical protein